MKVIILLLILVFCLFYPVIARAESKINCENRFLTLVNPVRSRELWLDKTTTPLKKQYEAISDNKLSATWLLQYDVLKDPELIKSIKIFDSKQELGLLLEVSPSLAKDAQVIYPHEVEWSDPQAVFLSGYQRTERRKLIRKVFTEFKSVFGYYPKSIGAWWIDSYSLEYIEDKFDVDAVLIVADQKTTDDYGIWGQWWGIPYYPHKANILVPAASEKEKEDVIILQWAQRDLNKAHGEGKEFSNYSLQANDYLERGLNTDYYKDLTKQYLDCSLSVGQITVGLETGMESVRVFPEYEKQIEYLSNLKELKSATMSQFADEFKKVYKNNPQKVVLNAREGNWILSLNKRENQFLKENLAYQGDLAFLDYFLADKSKFLDRTLPINKSRANTLPAYPFLILGVVFGCLLFLRQKLTLYFIPVSLFIFSAFATTLISYSKYGWHVYYGPVVESIPLTQFLLISIFSIFFLVMIKLLRKNNFDIGLLMWLTPLSFGLDFLIMRLRYTFYDNLHQLGFMINPLKLLVIRAGTKVFDIGTHEYQPEVAGAFLKFNFTSIWNNIYYTYLVYPLFHIIIALVIYFILVRLNKKFRKLVIIIMIIPFIMYILSIFGMDPRVIN